MEADLFGKVFILAQHLGRRADAALAPAGLTSRQWLLLAVLVRGFPGTAPTLTDAAQAYGTSRQNVKQVALQLAARGYVELRADHDDRRATRLVVTARVTEFDEPAAVAVQTDFLADAFASLDDAEVVTLHRLVDRCVASLTAQVEP